MECCRFNQDFRNADFVEPVRDLAGIDLFAGGTAAVDFAPFSKSRPLVIAVPEAPVEDFGKFSLQGRCKSVTVSPFAYCIGGAAVTGSHLLYIFRTAGPALDFEDRHSAVYDFVHKLNSAEVFGRHNVFVVHEQLIARFQVRDLIAPAADLVAGPTVGGSPVLVQAQVAFAGNRHTQRSVGKHLDFHRTARRPADTFPYNGLVYFLHLMQVEFPCQHHHICKLRVKPQRFDIRNAQLGGNMHFQTYAAGIDYGSHIGCDDCRNACRLGCIKSFPHRLQVFLIQDYVEGKIGLYAILTANPADLGEVLRREIVC